MTTLKVSGLAGVEVWDARRTGYHRPMIAVGVVLLIVGYLTGIGGLWLLGVILLVGGAFLWIAGVVAKENDDHDREGSTMQMSRRRGQSDAQRLHHVIK
jgi:hypothetical protein